MVIAFTCRKQSSHDFDPRRDAVMKTLETKLREVGLGRETLPVFGTIFWRGILLGTALFLSLTDDPDQNLRHNFISYIVALVWCYYDGIFARDRWSAAWLEGLFLHLIGVAVGNLLTLIVGNPLIPEQFSQ